MGCDPLIGWKSFQWVTTNTSNYNDDDDGIVHNIKIWSVLLLEVLILLHMCLLNGNTNIFLIVSQY